jgi:hypothetical protein
MAKLWAGRREFDFRQRQGLFLFAATTKPVLGSSLLYSGFREFFARG